MSRVQVGRENSGVINLYYEDHGSGTPVVLIHGWPLSGASWEKQVSALLQDGHRVITYDRRGFGRSSKPSVGYDYDTFASDLHTLVTRLELPDFALVGFSMGTGEVARYLSTYGSEHVTKAVFIASLPPYLLKCPDNPDGVDGKAFEDIKLAIATDRLAFLTGFFGNFFNADALLGDRVSQESLQFSWNTASHASPQGTLECVQTWLTDFRGNLPAINVPTLIIHGDADRILPIEATGTRLHQAISGSQLLVVKDGPHGLLWTHADILNPALVKFLKTRNKISR